MKYNKLGYFIFGGLVFALALSYGLVQAEENSGGKPGNMMQGLGGMITRVFVHKDEAHATGSTLEVHIYDNGTVLVRGAKVTGIAGQVISAHTDWGDIKLDWAINTEGPAASTETTPGAKVIRRLGGLSNVDSISVGDFISFHGQLVTTTSSPLTVNADIVKDWSLITQPGNSGVKENTEHEQDERTVRAGTIKSIDGTTLVVTAKDKDYTVNTDSDTTFLNAAWQHVTLSALVVGNRVQVYGEVNDTTITATVVRDMSL